MNIGFIGNFIPPFSTENDRKWSFEQLGHNVITFQEDMTTSAKLYKAINEVDIMFYSHTHGWNIPNLKDVFQKYKAHGVPTVSVHLDRWAGLDRVKDMGSEATWFTEWIFMADGSPEAQEIYNNLGLKWKFLKPGVVARECYMSMPDHDQFPHEIIFVGSKGYHPEYPFRPQLIEFLKNTYGWRFGHYGNDGIEVVRGDRLNKLYASAKIAVGDSCFGGRPYYVSDRYYETRGRGGFLIHPHVEGIDTFGVVHYEPGNLDQLKQRIDFFLENEKERENMRQVGHTWVRDNETYTHRAQEILNTVFDKR